MKAYKSDLSHFFSVKKEEEAQLKKTLLKKSFEEKKAIIEDYRASVVLDQGTYVVGEHQFKRQEFIRDIHYLEQLKDELAKKHAIFNRYKYEVLYELKEMNEADYDRMATQINELKEKRDEYISKKAAKQDEMKAIAERFIVANKKLLNSYNDPNTELEQRKVIYSDIISNRIGIFELIKPNLTMVRVDKLNTIVQDYVPIRGHQRNIMKLSESVEPVDISPIVLEPDTIPNVIPERPVKKSLTITRANVNSNEVNEMSQVNEENEENGSEVSESEANESEANELSESEVNEVSESEANETENSNDLSIISEESESNQSQKSNE